MTTEMKPTWQRAAEIRDEKRQRTLRAMRAAETRQNRKDCGMSNPFKCLFCGKVYEYGDPNHSHN